MACPGVSTGQEFLLEVLTHLDCQAQSLGAFGFAALSEPGSPAAVAVNALLALFVAVFAFRLLFAGSISRQDIVGAVLKVGIVLTLAFSWPAYRTLVYDLVLYGPSEIAEGIVAEAPGEPGVSFTQRLQNIDTGITRLTALGSGRQSGSLELEEETGGFQAIAMEDERAWGWARTLYLGSTIGSLAALRIAAGLLLALAPIFAGLLLFDVSRGLFAGWVRGLTLTMLGSLGYTAMLSVEIALLDPWLTDTISRRTLGYATPNAPTELLAMTLGFAIAAGGLLFLLTKVAFQNAWRTSAVAVSSDRSESRLDRESRIERAAPVVISSSRAGATASSVNALVQRETVLLERYTPQGGAGRASGLAPEGPPRVIEGRSTRDGTEALGSGYRRNRRRSAGSQVRREKTK